MLKFSLMPMLGKGGWIAFAIAALVFFSGCSIPSVSAESRIFLPLSLEYLGAQTLPKSDGAGISLGQITDVVYDRGRDRIYATLGDSPSPRVVSLKLALDPNLESPTPIQAITPESVTSLDSPSNTRQTAAGLALGSQTLWVTRQSPLAATPISAFNLPQGEFQQSLPLPKRLRPPEDADPEAVSDLSTGLKAVTLDPEGQRLFTATEQPLLTSASEPPMAAEPYSHFFHYWIGEPEPYLLAEHLYPLGVPSSQMSRLVALTTLDSGGHFLSLEQYRDAQGMDHAQIFQLATGDATDVSAYDPVPFSAVVPIRKQPLIELSAPEIPVSSELGMTLGPYLPDGSRSLLISAHPSTTANITQLLLLRLFSQSSKSLI
ncbi:esterase-like activity of phytase family protein [Synechococcales cyanobacterium C]|uniref:Esterase-like activity of phytase family protein n=1 Tax=Petrachloros mirabilis ULC683 TaxID=2781853 RepID=A0A8K2A6N5_9CYAN|nr:esterase-like activity of phytase family protein [Petrachloros mirabilis ULC683]